MKVLHKCHARATLPLFFILSMDIGVKDMDVSPENCAVVPETSEGRGSQQLGYKLVGDNIDKTVKTRYVYADGTICQQIITLFPFFCRSKPDRFHFFL